MQTWLIVLLAIVVLVAIWIAATAVFSAIVTRRHPPVGKFVEVDGVRLHYVERGPKDAPALLLLHGNGMMLQDFRISEVLDGAAERYHVISFDRPGFGHSSRPRHRIWAPGAQAELFAAALRQLGIGRAVVLGHSWATLIGVEMALRFPDLVEGLVLAAGYYFPTMRKDIWLSGPAIPIVGDLMRYTVSPPLAWAILPKLLRKLFAPRPVPERFLREFPLPMAVRPLHLRAGAEEIAYMIPAAASLQHRYGELTCPIAVVWGEKDEVIDSDQSEHVHRELMRSIVRRVPDAGHMVHYVAPERLIDAAALIFAWPQVGQPETVA
jgi:pimeloyl-ACP methyl ester carboxylesterase